MSARTKSGPVGPYPAPERGKRRESLPLSVRSGSAVVMIYGPHPGPYTAAWREGAGGPRRRAVRADWKEIREMAQAQAELVTLFQQV